MNLQQLAEQIIELDPTCSCGHPLHPKDIRCRSHPNGILLDDHPEPQWVYLHCPMCSYDTSLPKILGRNTGLQRQITKVLPRLCTFLSDLGQESVILYE